ncbi:MAG: hypothetical protein V1936_05085 [Patescibacteria group bacterium]
MLLSTNLKKIVIALTICFLAGLGIISLGRESASLPFGQNLENLAPQRSVKIDDLTKIDWEIQVIEERQIARN